MAHRLAWVYMFEHEPVGDIDHINMVKSDNRLLNLREATRSQNKANEGLRSTNTSGFRGVSKSNSKWAASIWMNGKQRVIGRYANKEDAAKAYDAMALKIHGNYARVNFPENNINSARAA
ncbi:endonuclease [Caudoviricetes sp.]|nr:endonuclease [Caudoviricetes sp.]UOF81492.1 endonuclease [Caudoviricetes sp.]